MLEVYSWTWLLVLGLGILWRTHSSAAELRVVCYYTNWSVYRPGTAKFSPQNINPYLCTHLIYAFGGFTKENTFKPFDKYQDIEKGGYSKFTGLKTYNKELKTLIAVGGWNEGSSRFSTMVANLEKRHEFVKNSVKFLRQNHFDGLDLDWEYPSFRDGGKPHDKDNYAMLVQELREEYDRESEKTGRPRLLLTMAVPAGVEYINKGYDLPKLMKYLDWMNVLSYDYHSAFEPSLNHHSPLYSLEEESEYNYNSDLNINHTIHHYLDKGAEREKLVLGIPTYGRSYTLFNSDATNIGDAADGPGEMGEATRENGYLAYYEICERIKSDSSWIVKQPNPNALGPYAYKDKQWVGYDDENIARKKAEFVAENKLGGIMFWSIDNDDFRGTCHGRPYPLIEAAKEALIKATDSFKDSDNSIQAKEEKPGIRLRQRTRKPTTAKTEGEEKPPKTRKRLRNQEESKQLKQEETEVTEATRRRIKSQSKRRTTITTTTTSTSKPSSTTPHYQTPEPPSTPDPGGDFKCEDEGFFPHPRDCKKYFWCLSGPSETGVVAHQFTCPAGLYFNKLADSCDYTQNVLCSKKTKTTTPSTTTSTTSTTTTTTTHRTSPKTSTTTSTTTTQAPEEDYEDEYEEDEIQPTKATEEDPKVIKELIDLIKKAGGIEELEKQLKLNENTGTSVSAPGSTTPSALSKSLYERILANRAKLNTSDKTEFRNSRGPQYEKLNEPLPLDSSSGSESNTGSKKTRLQYTAISRQRPTKDETPENKQIDENVADDDNKPIKHEYKTIARPRPTSVLEIGISSSTSSTRISDEIENIIRKQTPPSIEYVTIHRSRHTTTEVPLTSQISESVNTSDNNNLISAYSPEIPIVAISSEIPIEEETTTSTHAPTTPKVSELVPSRTLLRTRFSANNRLKTSTSNPIRYSTTHTPRTQTLQLTIDELPEAQNSQEESYERKFRPNIASEISDLSSLTSADLSSNRNRKIVSRRPYIRRTTTTEEVQQAGSDAIPEIRRKPGSIRRNTTPSGSVSNILDTTTPRILFRSQLKIQRKRIENATDATPQSSVLPSKPMRKVIRRHRVTSTTESNQIQLGGEDENVSLEEGENIKLSESEIRLNSLSSNDKVKDEPFGKRTYIGNAATELAPAERSSKSYTVTSEPPELAEHFRYVEIRKEKAVSTTEPINSRPRKIIRKLKPSTEEPVVLKKIERNTEVYEIPINQRRRKVHNIQIQTTKRDTVQYTEYSTIKTTFTPTDYSTELQTNPAASSDNLNNTDLTSTIAMFANIAQYMTREPVATSALNDTLPPKVLQMTTGQETSTSGSIENTEIQYLTTPEPHESNNKSDTTVLFVVVEPIFNKSMLTPNVSESTPPMIKNESEPPFLYLQDNTVQTTKYKTTSQESKSVVNLNSVDVDNRFGDNSNTENPKPTRFKTTSITESGLYKRTNRRYAGITRTTPVPPSTLSDDIKNSRNKLFKNRNRKTSSTLQIISGTTEPSTTTTTLQQIFTDTTTPTTTKPTQKDKKLERLIEVNRIVEVSLKENKIQKHHPPVHNMFTLVPSLDRIGAINRITEIKVVDPEVAQQLDREGGKNAIEHAKPVTPKPTLNVETSTIALEALFNKNVDELLETQNARYVNVRILKQDVDDMKKHNVNTDAPVLPIRLLNLKGEGLEAHVVEVTPRFGSNFIKIAPISLSLSPKNVN